jgi:type VII secretion integral membrane protein EccD
MSSLVALRRVTIVAPTARVDISLPVQSTVAELLPSLVEMAANGADVTAGWSLARLGAEPFPGSATVTSAGIRDGELLYLNPRDHQPTPLLFDDVVDAIAHAAARRAGTWRPELSRRVGLLATVTALAALSVLLGVAGIPGAPAITGGLAVVLLVTAAALSRAFGDAGAGAAVAIAGLPAALLAGIEVAGTGTVRFPPSAGGLAVGCGTLLVYAVLSAVAVAHRVAVFAGVSVTAMAGGIAASAAILTNARPSSVSALLVPIAVVLSPALPMLALRVARLPLPRIPTDTAAFRADERPTLGPQVVGETEAAEAVLTGLLGAVATLVLAGAIGLLADGSVWARVLGGVAGLALLLRARAYVSIGQRGVLMLGGVGALLVTAGKLAVSGGDTTRVALVLGMLAVGLVCLVYALRAVDNQPSPYWSRLIDMVEFLALISLMPLAAAVLDIFTKVRGLGG